MIFQTLEGHLRAILGTLTVEEINADRQAFAQKMTDEAAVDLKKMGVNIDILTIQQISDEQGYLDALGKKRTAEVKRDAVIGEAHAQRDAMIKSAMADQEGKTKRYEADVTIAQSLRDKESRQAEFDAAVKAKQAEAEQAGPLATAIARQKVTEQETRIDQVRKQQEVLVQEQEAARREQELQATVVKPAEAERQAAILRAEGEKQATVIRAEATQKELEFEGAGEAAKIEKIGRAEAAKVLAVGEAEAEVIKKKLLAEAEGLQKKAEAWKNFNDAAVINMVVDKMPELAQAFATQLAGIDKINIIEMGNGMAAGSGGVGQGDGHRRRRDDGDARHAEGSVRHRHRAADAGQDRGRRGRGREKGRQTAGSDQSHERSLERRPARSVTSGLLERVGQLQDAPVISMTADDLQPNRQAAVRESSRAQRSPGSTSCVTYQHDRIQSMYVVIAVPAISVGYGVSTSNGSTCVTGRMKYS